MSSPCALTEWSWFLPCGHGIHRVRHDQLRREGCYRCAVIIDASEVSGLMNDVESSGNLNIGSVLKQHKNHDRLCFSPLACFEQGQIALFIMCDKLRYEMLGRAPKRLTERFI